MYKKILSSIIFASSFLSSAYGIETNSNENLPNFIDLVEKSSPAVVNISTTSHISSSPVDDFFSEGLDPQLQNMLRNFLGNSLADKQTKREVKSLGSGFVIDADGYVVTNNHVVGGADKIEINFPNGTRYNAKIIGSDEKTDLALLKIDSNKKFPYLKWGNSEKLRVGQWVLAIGNPYGLAGSVTKGIVSALNRDIESGPYDNFIQTDAAINRGNSGGPLFNLSGEVIGVNSAIISPSGGSVGVGFAIPSSLAQNITNQIKKSGHVNRGWLGISMQALNDDLTSGLGLAKNTKGILVGDVTKNSPAQKAGIMSGDVIIAIDGKEISNIRDISRLVATMPIGTKLNIDLLRNNKKQSVIVITQKQPSNPPIAMTKSPSGSVIIKDLGIAVLDIKQALKKYYNITNLKYGVFIDDIDISVSGTIEKGDIITSLNQKPVLNVQNFIQTLENIKTHDYNRPIMMQINRQGMTFYVAIRISK